MIETFMKIKVDKILIPLLVFMLVITVFMIVITILWSLPSYYIGNIIILLFQQ